jgi:ATP synthase protein I
MIIRIASKPIRTVLTWQCFAAAGLAVVAGLVAGIHGAISALLGGMVSIVAGLGFALVMARSKDRTAGGALLATLRAEAVKVGLIVILLWLVLATYSDVVVPGFIGSFIVSVIIFAMAISVRDN